MIIKVSEGASSLNSRLGYLTASSFAFVDWYVLAWILGCLPILFLCGTIMMPESPVWLLSNGREEEARRSLQYKVIDKIQLKILLQIKEFP
jgi:hypothetical protein